jgi:hypothetical protein
MISEIKVICFVYEDVTYFRWSSVRWYEEITCGDIVLIYESDWLENVFQKHKRLDRLTRVGLL